MALTQQQINKVQIDYGVIYINYGETNQTMLGPTRGGGTFTVTKNIRDIEYDGRRGKTKGLQVVDEINAMLSVSHLDTSMQTLALALPYATLEGDGAVTPYSIKCGGDGVSVLPSTAYLANVTMFAKTIDGKYKKITLYNAMNEADFEFTAAPKAEGEIALEIYAHWDATNDTQSLFEIADVDTIA